MGAFIASWQGWRPVAVLGIDLPMSALSVVLIALATIILCGMLIAVRRSRGDVERALGEMQESQRRQEAALEASQRLAEETDQLFRALFDDAIVGMCRSTREGRFLSANHALARMFGYDSPEEMLARVTNIAEQLYVRPQQRGEAIDIIRERGGIERYEVEVRRKDGSHIWILEHIREVRDAAGNPMYLIGTIQDVSLRRLLEDKVRQAQKMESIGRLTGGVAHDFNNLLTAILGYAQFAEHKLDAGHPVHTYLEQISKAGERAEKLTRQLLNFCRQEPMERQTFDLNLVVKETGFMLRRLIGEDIDLHMHLATDGALITADSGEIGQVVMNLALNARDAMPHGGTLTIVTSVRESGEADPARPAVLQPGRNVVLTVRDEGSGMDSWTLAKIFEPFFTTKDRGHGTGLGLSTAHDIVCKCGGEITVESTPGKGTCFDVWLPLAVDKVTSEPARPGSRAPATVSGEGPRTVLVVEDEEILRTLMVDILEGRGYHALSSADGDGALKIMEAQDGAVNLVVTDVVMPRMSGFQLVSRIVHRWPEVQVLYISGHGEHTAFADATDSAAGFSLLEKPFGADEFARAVRKALGQTSAVAPAPEPSIAAASV